MSVTKRLVSDQVLFRIYGGFPDVNAPVQKYDIWKALEQKINSLFSMQQFSLNLPSGETIPNNLALATYEDITVTRTSNERSKATLPVMPITLPRNAGINEIRPVLNIVSSGDRMLGQPFIPIQAGQGYLLQADSLLNDMMGQISYEPSQKTVIFSKDITTLGMTKVDMKLVVFDMSQYSETDVLPIPADMEQQIINELIQQFAPVQAESGIQNPVTTAGQQNNK